MSDTPFDNLTPDTVLNAIDSTGYHTDGRLMALNSYENRVYQVGLEDGSWVVAKFYRPARWSDAEILEEHEFTWALADHEIPAVAPLRFNGSTLHVFEDYRFALFPRVGGRQTELETGETLQWMGRLIARLHNVGAVAPFKHRPTLDIESFGKQSMDFLLQHDWLPAQHRDAYADVATRVLAAAQTQFERAGDVAQIRLHGDCHVGNVLWTEFGPAFVDLDDSRMGPAVQDLWMLLSGDRQTQLWQLGEVVDGYEMFCEFDRRELHLIEPLRALRLMNYAAWLARRWNDPAFPQTFTWFGTENYWLEHISQLREQIVAMNEPVLVV